MKKQTQLFLTLQDEEDISRALRETRANIRFLDDNVWTAPEPIVKLSITSCKSPFVFLWDSSIVDRLPTRLRSNGTLEGPVSGMVIQLIRSRLNANVLLSGRIAAGLDMASAEPWGEQMKSFIEDVWNIFNRSTRNTLAAVDRHTGVIAKARVPEYRAGHHALLWGAQNSEHIFKDRSTENYFQVNPSNR